MKEIDYGIDALAAAISKATSAADRLLKCAESISNPTYVVMMDGRELEILAAAHTAGVITLRVKSPFTDVEAAKLRMIKPRKVAIYALGIEQPLGNKCSTLYGFDTEGDCGLCGFPKRVHDGSF